MLPDLQTILIIAVVILAVLSPFYWRTIRKGADDSKQKRLLSEAATAMRKGGKPFGEPYNSAMGGAYFMLPEQLVEKDYGFRAGTPAPFGKRLSLGYVMKPQDSDSKALLFTAPQGHIITVAPTRTGKGTCHIIPNLLDYTGSVIVNDIKGENYAITHKRRIEHGAVYKFSPFDGHSHGWNPIQEIVELDDEEDQWEAARLMADMLIVSTENGNSFWEDEARNLLTAIILFVVLNNPKDGQTMSEVRHYSTQSESGMAEFVQERLQSHENTTLRRAGNVFGAADSKVKSGIISTLNSQMAVWDSPKLERAMRKSDFTFKTIKENSGSSLYFILPFEKLQAYRPVMRLFFGMAINALTKGKNPDNKPDTVLFLDEFPQLGHMKPIENGISFIAGYGCRLWLFAQDLKQIEKHYSKVGAATMLGNCATRCFFTPNDIDTAEYLSKLHGDMTITVEGSKDSFSYSKQPLMLPQELMGNMNREYQQAVFFQGEMPVTSGREPYYENPKYNGYYETWEG